MAIQIDIPEDEMRQFHPFVHIYSKDKVIVSEGDRHDNRIFLLRQGEVQVLKWVGDHQQELAKIQSVNFFGEMAVFSNRPRSATIVAATDPVVLYVFEKPNITNILRDPKWSTLLIKRLIDNLEQMNNEFEQAQLKVERFQSATSNLLGILLSLCNAGKQDESIRKMFVDAIPELIKAHMRETGIELVVPDNYRLDQYRRNGIIPEKLYFAATTPSQKKLE